MEVARKTFQSNPTEAFDLYRKIVRIYDGEAVATKAAIEASRDCRNDRECSGKEEFFLQYIVKNSNNENDQIEAQLRLSEIYYDKGFYSQAIEEMNRILSKKNYVEGRRLTQLKLAKSNFYIKNFYQAEVELNNYLKIANNDQERFEGYLLRADILSANKKHTEALATYKEIKDKFEELYFKNQVYMNEVLLLEDQRMLDQAVSVLESVKSGVQNHEFIESKIERLKERRALMPGASGLKR